MTDPQLFPNQPTPEEHLAKHSSNVDILAPLNTKINNIATRLKILEERQSSLQKKLQLAETNIIEVEKDSYDEIQLISSNILNVKKGLADLTEKVSLLTDEVENFVPMEKFKVLEKYISFWQPMDFVTRNEINAFLRKKFSGEKTPQPNESPKKIIKESDNPDETTKEEKTRKEIASIMEKKNKLNKK